MGFYYRTSTGLGEQTLGGHKQNLVRTRSQEKGAVSPQETESDLSVKLLNGDQTPVVEILSVVFSCPQPLHAAHKRGGARYRTTPLCPSSLEAHCPGILAALGQVGVMPRGILKWSPCCFFLQIDFPISPTWVRWDPLRVCELKNIHCAQITFDWLQHFGKEHCSYFSVKRNLEARLSPWYFNNIVHIRDFRGMLSLSGSQDLCSLQAPHMILGSEPLVEINLKFDLWCSL